MTPTPNLFKKLLHLSLATLLIGIVIDLALPGLIPQELRTAYETYNTTYWDSASMLNLAVQASLALVALVSSVAVYIGFYTFKPWARKVNITLLLSMFVLYPIMEVSVVSGWSDLFTTLSGMLWGAITLLSYLPPISDKFEKKSVNND